MYAAPGELLLSGLSQQIDREGNWAGTWASLRVLEPTFAENGSPVNATRFIVVLDDDRRQCEWAPTHYHFCVGFNLANSHRITSVTHFFVNNNSKVMFYM